LFGATSVAQIDENLSALSVQAALDPDLLAQMTTIFPLS